jgi:hypothetical protein
MPLADVAGGVTHEPIARLDVHPGLTRQGRYFHAAADAARGSFFFMKNTSGTTSRQSAAKKRTTSM